MANYIPPTFPDETRFTHNDEKIINIECHHEDKWTPIGLTRVDGHKNTVAVFAIFCVGCGKIKTERVLAY